MESFVDFLCFVASAIIIGGLVLLLIASYQDYNTPYDYAYVDLDGNTGFADVCRSDKSFLSCSVGDKKITVKEYSRRGKEHEKN